MKEKILLFVLGAAAAAGVMLWLNTPAHASPVQMVGNGRYVFQPAKVSAYVASSEGFTEINTVVRGDYQTGEVWVLQATAASLVNPHFSEVAWVKVPLPGQQENNPQDSSF